MAQMKQMKRAQSDKIADFLDPNAPTLNYAVSDPLQGNNSSSPAYEVRPCRVEDTESIDSIMRKAWPDEPEWRNPQYWTKEFIKPNSIRYGYVIEQEGKVKGVALYKWTQPIPVPNFVIEANLDFNWFTVDLNTVSYEWDKGFNEKTAMKYNLYYNNDNLKKNWDKLSSHIVHITDVAIHPHERGKGLGTQLMQSMIYSFPSGTRFGLEVLCTNGGAIKCYKKCGVLFN